MQGQYRVVMISDWKTACVIFIATSDSLPCSLIYCCTHPPSGVSPIALFLSNTSLVAKPHENDNKINDNYWSEECICHRHIILHSCLRWRLIAYDNIYDCEMQCYSFIKYMEQHSLPFSIGMQLYSLLLCREEIALYITWVMSCTGCLWESSYFDTDIKTNNINL